MALDEKLKSQRILIVEDEPDNNDMVQFLLEEAGFNQTTQAFNGQQALDQINQNPPDLILLDIMLPDIDGFQICKGLKTHRQTNQIVIIMLTALVQQQNRIKGFRVGANDYITKPFESQELVELITSQLIKRIEHRKEAKMHLDLAFNSEVKYLDELNQVISQILKETPLDEESVEEIRAGLYEVGVNAIEWGNRFNKDLNVQVSFTLFEDRIELLVKDEGSGFDFSQFVQDDYNPIDHMDTRVSKGKRIGGYGILIAKKYFDSVEFEPGKSQVKLIRQFDHVSQL